MTAVVKTDKPIGFGSRVQVKGGGPIMLVVDVPNAIDPAAVMVAWRDKGGKAFETYMFVATLDHLVVAR